jgi:hypothetical protein
MLQTGGTVHTDGWGRRADEEEAEEVEEGKEEEEEEEEVEEEKEEGDEKPKREPATPGLLVRLREHAISDSMRPRAGVGLAGTTCPLPQKFLGNSRRNYERAFFLFEGLCAARRVRPKHFQVMLQTCR